MTATNHVVTGAVIAAAVPVVYIALPAALLSHLVLDALPHYGNKDHTSKTFLYMLAGDMGLASAFLIFILVMQPVYWPLLIASAILAASPDLLWLRHWILELRGGKARLNKLEKFLSDIQWAERNSIYNFGFEVLWFLLGVAVFLKVAF
jgi:hypothetical protein